jgi:hypothetical protein
MVDNIWLTTVTAATRLIGVMHHGRIVPVKCVILVCTSRQHGECTVLGQSPSVKIFESPYQETKEVSSAVAYPEIQPNNLPSDKQRASKPNRKRY